MFPGNTSNHHLHSVAAKAIAFAEMIEFGEKYASQIVKNAKALAEALHDQGFRLLGEKNGFTQSHQIAVEIMEYGDGGTLEEKLEKANIIMNRQLLPGDIQAGRHYMHPGGLRIGVQEVTRLGMTESEMVEIANLITKVVIKKSDVTEIRKDVIEFRKNFQKVHYAFENMRDAYDYVNIRTK